MTAQDHPGRLARLDAALAALETAVIRVVAAERSREDLAETLAVMDEDRQRLAAELDTALARAKTLENAGEAVERRLEGLCERFGALRAGTGEG